MPSGPHVARADIDRAAALVFRREGFRGSTMQQIADEVGLHKTSLYHHITSKESLLRSIAEVAIGHSLSEIERIAADARLAPDERLRAAVHMQVLEIATHPDQVAVFTMFLHEIRDDEARRAFIAQRDRYGELMQRLVADVLGVDPNGEQASMAALGVLGMCNWMLTWYHADRGLSATSLADTFADMAVRSVGVG